MIVAIVLFEILEMKRVVFGDVQTADHEVPIIRPIDPDKKGRSGASSR